jgi:hypothetical protein
MTTPPLTDEQLVEFIDFFRAIIDNDGEKAQPLDAGLHAALTHYAELLRQLREAGEALDWVIESLACEREGLNEHPTLKDNAEHKALLEKYAATLRALRGLVRT